MNFCAGCRIGGWSGEGKTIDSATTVTEFQIGWKSFPLIRAQDDFICPERKACWVSVIKSNGTMVTGYEKIGKDFYLRPVVTSGDQLTMDSKVTMCVCKMSTGVCTGPTGKNWTIIPEEDFWICNATEITNRTRFLYMIKVVPKIKMKYTHIVPLIPTCQRMGIAAQETVVHWTVQFPAVPACEHRRMKRDWLGTLLGGSGTIMGVSNTIDNQIISSKLSKTGKWAAYGLDKQAKWMPTVTKTMKDSIKVFKEMYKVDFTLWNDTSDVLEDLKKWIKWTTCTIGHLHVLAQQERMQRILTSNNVHDWRNHWNMSYGLWLQLMPGKTRCDQNACTGYWKQYNVTNTLRVCRYHVLPLIIGEYFWNLKVEGDWMDPHTNQTYDLRDCDQTDGGLICTLRNGHTNPCLTKTTALCEWTRHKGEDLMLQVGPHTLCIATLHKHPLLAEEPFSGCLENVHVWTWHNVTWLMTNFTWEEQMDKVQWEIFHGPWGISLERFRGALERSTELKQIIENHDENLTRLHVSTLMVAGQVKMAAKVVESASHWSFWDIFGGWSSTAQNVLAPPLIVLIVIITLLTLCNVCTCIYVNRMRGNIMQILYHAR